jgi:hypothetical protein
MTKHRDILILKSFLEKHRILDSYYVSRLITYLNSCTLEHTYNTPKWVARFSPLIRKILYHILCHRRLSNIVPHLLDTVIFCAVAHSA